MKKVLVVDIGGTNVKAMISREARRKFASGGGLTPRQLHDMLDGKLDDWAGVPLTYTVGASSE